MLQNVTLLNYQCNVMHPWRLLDPDGCPIPAFEIFARNIKRPNTRKNYLHWLAEFFDFLFEAAAWTSNGSSVSHDALVAIVEAYDDYLVLGESSGNPIARRISQTMPSPHLSRVSSSVKHAAIRRFLKLSERVRMQMLELTNAGFPLANPSQEKLISGLAERREPSAYERLAMVRNSMLAGCIAKGPQLIAEGVLPTSSPEITYEHERAFPFDKVAKVLNQITAVRLNEGSNR